MRHTHVIIVSLAVAAAALTAPASGQTVTIGQNFTGTTLAQSGFIPPDTMGAAGPQHLVELINGRFVVYDKAGSQQQSKTLNQFWTSAGVTPAGSYAFDPRVLYDSHSGRWFAASVDNGGGANNFLVAVSETADPTGNWAAFAIDSDSANQRWADFPTMGVNGDVLVLAANMFPIRGGATRINVLVLPKTDLLAPTPTVASHTLFQNVNSNSIGFSVQPIVDMDNSSLPLPLLSSSNKASGKLKRTNVTGTPASPSLATSGGTITVTARSTPTDADQPGAKQNIETSDSRFSGNAVLQNGSIWAAHAVRVSGRAAIEWYEIRESDNAVLQSGLIADADLAYYFPSIAVNDFGDVVIGFSGSSETQFVSTYAAVGQTAAGVTTFASPLLLKAGLADYERLDWSDRNRWGDYSATTLDPTNPYHFWTFQEFVTSTDRWAVQITELIVPKPADFDGDADMDADDIDLLCANLDSADPQFDLDGDGDADEDDLILMIETLAEWHNTASGDSGLGTARGDFNLDGLVDGTDLALMKTGFGQTGLGHAGGNANCDALVDATDLAILKANFGSIALTTGDPIPEPMTAILLAVGALIPISSRRRRRT
ncbi:hypothetical protein LCGC14_0692510 [marine sediment metagenome]|uniref:PEP-CTERM protein-sorting domain-containing protein n=1 Tax=marine sediment metagenome TaxID=412755 RepID=A0A0F9QK51_9ZZZZ|nr:hypothetical protein [Phycisphaerae bacterium]